MSAYIMIGPRSFGYTTCAPRGIFNTKSANRGRNAVITMPFDVSTRVPSGLPSRSSCGSVPLCVWYVPPVCNVIRYVRSR